MSEEVTSTCSPGDEEWAALPKYCREEMVALFGPDLDGPLKLDSRVLTGVLANGATYYVRANAEPQKRAEVRVILRVGSVLEADDQQGIAHMIEHLAFRASTNDADEESFKLVKELEAHGITFGAHQNALTGFDETQYELAHLPTDDEQLLERSFSILRRLALEVRLSAQDVEGERDIIVEEQRQRRSGSARASESFTKLLLQGSKYAERFPIGLMSVIKSVGVVTLKDFFDRYYNPENLCVVAVGDFDCDKVVGYIESAFASAVSHPGAVPLPSLFAVPSHPEPLVSVFADPEISSISVIIEVKRHGSTAIRDLRSYREDLVRDMACMALSTRLEKLALETDPVFISAAASQHGSMSLPHLSGFHLSASVGDRSRIVPAVRTLVEQVEAIKHGHMPFSAGELQRVRANIKSDLLADHMEREQIQLEELCEELVQLFLRDHAVLGFDEETKIAAFLLDDISDDEVQAVAQEIQWQEDCVVHVSMPTPTLLQGLGRYIRGKKPWREELEETIRTVLVRTQQNGVDEGALSRRFSEAVSQLPVIAAPAGQILSCRHYGGELDVHELELSNGLKVSYKRTRFQDDEVQYSALAYGGLSELCGDLRTFASARWADTLAHEFGILGFPPSHFHEILSGKRVSLDAHQEAYTRTIAGECSVRDLETALQMFHLSFVSKIEVNKERLRTVLRVWTERQREVYRNPLARFNELSDELNTCGHPFYRRIGEKDLKKLDVDLALQHFRKCYSDPAAFRLVLVGNLPPEAVLDSLIERYLASIPRSPPKAALPVLSRATVRPLNITFPSEPEKRQLALSMLEDQCSVRITYHIQIVGATWEERFKAFRSLRISANILERRLVEVLRFEDGSVYTVTCSISFGCSNLSIVPSDVGQGELFINTSCPPAKIDQLVERVFREVERLRQYGPKEEEVATVVKADKRSAETSKRRNGWWIRTIMDEYCQSRYHGDLSATFSDNERWTTEVRDSLNACGVVKTLRERVDTARYTVVSLRPRRRRRELVLLGGGVTLLALVGMVMLRRRQRL